MTSSISSSLAAIITQGATAQANSSSQATQAEAQNPADANILGSGFGSAVNLTLSPAAQAVLAASSANSNTASSPSSASGSSAASGSAAPAGGPPPGGGGAPVASSSTSSSVETLIEEDEQKLIPEVGVTGASEVIDSKGNIDEVKLQQLLAQQDQPPKSPEQTQTASSNQAIKLVA